MCHIAAATAFKMRTQFISELVHITRIITLLLLFFCVSDVLARRHEKNENLYQSRHNYLLPQKNITTRHQHDLHLINNLSFSPKISHKHGSNEEHARSALQPKPNHRKNHKHHSDHHRHKIHKQEILRQLSKRALNGDTEFPAGFQAESQWRFLPAPVFELPEYQTSVTEDVPVGKSLLQVKATMADGSAVTYAIDDRGNFTIDNKKGILYSNAKLDHDYNNGLYTFHVYAVSTATSKNSSADVRIYTSNTNDEAPKFSQDIYLAQVYEDARPSAVITTVVASDKDGDGVTYGFAVGSSFPSGMFVIDPNTGVIRLGPNKQEFGQDTYELNVTATDDGVCCDRTQTQHMSAALVVVSIIDVNDNRPVFPNCSTTVGNVKENSPAGSFVMKVVAVDNDRGENGKIQYQYVSKTVLHDFEIHPTTGVLTTKKPFDREGEDGKFVSAIIIARDNGSSPLEGVCSITIKIDDVNDNAPLFDRKSYSETIRRTALPGQNLFRLSATDDDSDLNAAIEYSLEPDGRDSSAVGYFSVDPNSGWVQLVKSPDRIQYQLVARATDKGNPPLHSTVAVLVQRVDSNANAPKWELSDYSIKVPENEKLDKVVLTMKAVSGIQDPIVLYKLVDGNTVQTNKLKTFYGKTEKLTDGTHVLKLLVGKVLDFETVKSYNITVRAENIGLQPLATETTVFISVTDVNDEIPQFQETEFLSVLEEQGPGARVGKINAIDTDGTYPFNKITYSLAGPPLINDTFSLDPDTGELTTLVSLSRENISGIQIYVKIHDGAPSARPDAKPNAPNEMADYFMVDIADINDNNPKFEKTIYLATVKEDEDTFHVVLTVTATDPDTASRLRYDITEGNVNSVFAVRPDTGEIYVSGTLDYETIKEYSLIVTVTDGLFENRTRVNISVEDVNDNKPKFEKNSYEATIWERSPDNTSGLPDKVIKVHAVDGDTDRPQNIIYKLSGQGTQPGRNQIFSIDVTTGEITSLKPLDRDPPNGRPQWKFNVFAFDEGGGVGSLDAYADVTVHLKDINDNAPTFPELSYRGTVYENSKIGTSVMTMTAVDNDDPNEGSNAKLTYTTLRSQGAENLFSIGSDGVIRTKVSTLDRETKDSYFLVIKATDGGQRSGTGTATITIRDTNDNPPKFEFPEYNVTIPESDGTYASNIPILHMTVLDADNNSTNQNSPQIIANNGTGWDKFSVKLSQPNTVAVFVSSQLDYEDPSDRNGFNFYVQVSDKGPTFSDPSHVAYTHVFINIFDINDNAPTFDNPLQTKNISEARPVGQWVADFMAKDADKNGLSKVSYAIDRESDRRRNFLIKDNGTVVLQRQLDREIIPRHVVKILAIDDGLPAKTATATLVVNVIDVNDNAPEIRSDHVVVVMENRQPPVFVTEVLADDKDDHSAGNGPKYTFALDVNAPQDIRNAFNFKENLNGDSGSGSATITTKVLLDREEKKEYLVPIVITDSGKPRLSSTNTLTIIVGDENDNPMFPSSSNVEVYNFDGRFPDSVIGRVYVEDADDWDLPDKSFTWDASHSKSSHFDLDTGNGDIIMKKGTSTGQYLLFFNVYDRREDKTVSSNATINVRDIPGEAVMSSGSIRMANINEDEFIAVWDQKKQDWFKSKYQMLRQEIATAMKTKVENVDVFTVKQKTGRPSFLDVRFSAHGSPYYEPEKLNGILTEQRRSLEETVGVNITMIGIDECLYEHMNCESSCSNKLVTSHKGPYVVNANRTSLAGVLSYVDAECVCAAREPPLRETCETLHCYNNGTCQTFPNGNVQCQCLPGFYGPRCQLTTVGFVNSGGYAWYPPLQQCEQSHFSIEFMTTQENGLIAYVGPMSDPDPGEIAVSDFFSLELTGGYPRMLLDYGSGTLELKVPNGGSLNDGNWHRIDVYWDAESARMVVDFCQASTNVNDNEIDPRGNNPAPVFDRSMCEAKGQMPPFNEFLNVNSPLQLGGVAHSQLNYPWKHEHSRVNFVGCVRNVVHNSEIYDLATPGQYENFRHGCLLTEEKCKVNDIQPWCVNGICDIFEGQAKCVCRPGFTGDKCEEVAPTATLHEQSYIKYSLKFVPATFKSDIQFRFRTWQPSGEIFRTSSSDFYEYLILEVKNSSLIYKQNLYAHGREEIQLSLPNVKVSDGRWHTVNVARYGSVVMLSLDGGEGRRYNETSYRPGIRQLITVDGGKVFVGGYLDSQTQMVLNDFNKSCIGDVRFDTLFQYLPVPPMISENDLATTSWDNVEASCIEPDMCMNISCHLPKVCLDLWQFAECRCPKTYEELSDGSCSDINECLVSSPCLNGATCENNEGGYMCICPTGFMGPNCGVLQDSMQRLALSSGALAAILVSALLILVLVLVLVVCKCRQHTSYGPVFPEDDIRENIINYQDEGGGEDDMNTYDIGPLRIPIDASGTPIAAKPGPERSSKEPRQNRGYSPDSEPDVGDFINNNLGKADEDPDALPLDDCRLYAYEGGGSDAGSLSSLASGTDDNEQDFDYLNNWGPRFQKLADMYGQGESEEE